MRVLKPDDARFPIPHPYVDVIQILFGLHTHVLNSLISKRGQNIQNKHLKTPFVDASKKSAVLSSAVLY